MSKDLPIIENINTNKPEKEKQDEYDRIFYRSYNLGARHMLENIITYLEDNIDIQSLDYLREQAEQIPRD